MTTEPKFEVRFTEKAHGELDPIITDITREIFDGTNAPDDRYLHEFVEALPTVRIVVKRSGNPTYALDLTLDGIHDLAKEWAYRREEALARRYENGTYDRWGYNDETKTANACAKALESCNAVLVANGRKAVTSYFND